MNEPLQSFYVHWNGAAMFVKEAEFFIQQGGLTEPWGKRWRGPIVARDVEDARVRAYEMWLDETSWPSLAQAKSRDEAAQANDSVPKSIVVWRCIWFLPAQAARFLFCAFIWIGWGKEDARDLWEYTR